jgi:uncharacterized protein
VRAVWNDEQARTNLVKHRLSFELAAEVFDDDLSLTNEDPFAVGERRYITMGLVRGVGLVVVVHTIENENTVNEHVRIISARRAERHEKKAFEDGRR